MTAKLANATALYMEGIRDGNIRQPVETYTGDRYTQHSTGVRDGVEGFVEFFEPFVERNPERAIQVVRGWEDGRDFFVHAHQPLNGGENEWVTADFFDTDDTDRIDAPRNVEPHCRSRGPSRPQLLLDRCQLHPGSGDVTRCETTVILEHDLQTGGSSGDGGLFLVLQPAQAGTAGLGRGRLLFVERLAFGLPQILRVDTGAVGVGTNIASSRDACDQRRENHRDLHPPGLHGGTVPTCRQRGIRS